MLWLPLVLTLLANPKPMPDPLTTQMLQRAVQTYADQNPEPAPTPQPPQSAPSKPSSGFDKLAHGVWLGGAAGDIGTTAAFQAHPEWGLSEGNPLVSWAPKGAQIPLGAGMELGAYLLGKKFLQPNHPKIFDALLMGAGALHGGAALHNLGAIQAARNQPDPHAGMVYKDGWWINPDYLPK